MLQEPEQRDKLREVNLCISKRYDGRNTVEQSKQKPVVITFFTGAC